MFQWQRIIISSHTAQRICGLILRKLRCYPHVKPVKMSRIRCSVCKHSRRAGEWFPGPLEAYGHLKKREKLVHKGTLQCLSHDLHLRLQVLALCKLIRVSLCGAALISAIQSSFSNTVLESHWSMVLLPAHQSCSWYYLSWLWHLPRPHFLLIHAEWIIGSELIISPSTNLLLLIRTDLSHE